MNSRTKRELIGLTRLLKDLVPYLYTTIGDTNAVKLTEQCEDLVKALEQDETAKETR